MDWQIIPVGLIVAGAVVYLCRESWQSWRGKKSGCGGGCQCAPKANITNGGSVSWVSADQLTVRLRSHTRPE